MSATNSLYSEHAKLYELIANDRNFELECELLRELAPRNNQRLRVLELFAGPAYHATCLQQDTHADVWCIDNSSEMKQIACEDYGFNPAHYKIANLPEELATTLPQGIKFDLILAMRYSIGLMKAQQLKELLINLEDYLEDGGIVILETHTEHNIQSHFSDLDIKVRRIEDKSTQQIIDCQWPSGKIEYNPSNLQVTMPIQIKTTYPDGQFSIIDTVSEETLFLPKDIRLLVDGHFTVCNCEIEAISASFPQSQLLLLQKDRNHV